jgi:hypothetical protein
MILSDCLQRPPLKPQLADVIREFLDQQQRAVRDFFRLCDLEWLTSPKVVDEIFAVLLKAGYGGTKYDLWHSVCGCDPPHKCVAGMKSGLAPWPPPGRIVATGRTRRPGSHRSA